MVWPPGTLRGGLRRRVLRRRVVQQAAQGRPAPALGGPGAPPGLGELLSAGGATWQMFGAWNGG